MKQKLLVFALLSSMVTIWAQKTAPIDSLSYLLKTSINDSSRGKILTQIGTYYMDNGNFPLAIQSLLKSKNIFENLKNEYGIFDCNNRLAITYCHTNNYKLGLEYLTQCKKQIDDGRLYDNLGYIHYNQNNTEQAKTYWEKSLDYYKSDTLTTARLFNKLGSCYEIQGKIKIATSYYNKSLEMSESINDRMGMVGAYASLGDIHFALNNYSTALEFENKSLKLSKELGDLLSTRETEKMLSDIYLQLGNCKASFEHFKNYISVRDSLVNEDNIKAIVKIEENHKFENIQSIEKSKQDKLDVIAQQEKQRQRVIIYSIGIGLILVMIFSIFIFSALKRNQKARMIITQQKSIVDGQKKDILDSIIYASRIQRAILPPDDFIKDTLPEHLIYFQPKDSVSGDFYFVDRKDDKIFWASCDATGHSVNGGMLSMLSMNILTEIIKEGETIPSKILDKLNERFNKSLHKKDDNSVRDGLDITICSLDKTTMELNFSGANNPLWIINNGVITEYKTDKMPIGQIDKKESYTNHTIQLKKDSVVYTFSDGICDLHSKENKKFMKKRFRELLLSVQDKSMKEQKNIISETLNKFKGQAEQVDDMLLIGIKI